MPMRQHQQPMLFYFWYGMQYLFTPQCLLMFLVTAALQPLRFSGLFDIVQLMLPMCIWGKVT